jgi:diaminopimelate epimerase
VFAARSAVIAVAWSSDYRVEGGGEELQHCRKKDNLVVQVDYPHCIGTSDKVSQTEFSFQKRLMINNEIFPSETFCENLNKTDLQIIF